MTETDPTLDPGLIDATARPPRKKRHWLLGLAVLFGLTLMGISLFAKDIDVRIDQETAQAALDRTIAEGPIKQLGTTLTPERFDIQFSSSDQVDLSAALQLEALQRQGRLDGTFKTGIRYSNGRFYLEDIDPVELNVDLDADTGQEASDIGTVLRERLQQERNRLVDREATEAFDRLVDRNEARVKDAAASAAQTFFTSIPIYDLRDAGTGGAVARLALSDMRFEEGVAILTLSPQLAVAKIINFILSVFFVIAYFVLRSATLSEMVIERLVRSNEERRP